MNYLTANKSTTYNVWYMYVYDKLQQNETLPKTTTKCITNSSLSFCSTASAIITVTN